jgi:hypothetical protein
MSASALQITQNWGRMKPTYLLSSLQWSKLYYVSATKLIIFPDIKSSISYIFLSVNAFICVFAPPPLNRSRTESRYSPLLGCWAAWHFLCIYELPLEKPAVKFRLTSIDFFVTSFFTTASLTCTPFLFSTFQMNLFFYVRVFPFHCPLHYNSSENHSHLQAHPQTTNFNAIFSHFCIQPPYGKG